MYAPMVYINTWTAAHHIAGDGYWLSVLNASSILGRLLPGVLADRYGTMNILIPHVAIASVLIFLFPLFDNVSTIPIKSAFFTLTHSFFSIPTAIHHCICHSIWILQWMLGISITHLRHSIGSSTLGWLSNGCLVLSNEHRWPPRNTYCRSHSRRCIKLSLVANGCFCRQLRFHWTCLDSLCKTLCCSRNLKTIMDPSL
jgi:MFS family permease